MKPAGYTSDILARLIKVSEDSIDEIIAERQSITADMAIRLAQSFDTTPELWTGLQADYDLRIARMEAQLRMATNARDLESRDRNHQRTALIVGVCLVVLNGLFLPFETGTGRSSEYLGYHLVFAPPSRTGAHVVTSVFFAQLATIITATAGAFFVFGTRGRARLAGSIPLTEE